MYEILFLIAQRNEVSLSALEQAITVEYAQHTDLERPIFQTEGKQLRIAISGFNFYIDHHCAPHIAKESQEIASQFAPNHLDNAKIAAATCRLELTSDEDLDMDYFNDLVFIISATETLGEVYTFDPQAGAFQ